MSDARRLPRSRRGHRRARLGRRGRVVRRPESSRRTFGSFPERLMRSVVSARSITVPSLSRTNQARRRERLRMKISAEPTSASFDLLADEWRRDRRLPLLPAPPRRGRPRARTSMRMPEAEAGNAAGGCRRSRHRPLPQLDDRRLRRRRGGGTRSRVQDDPRRESTIDCIVDRSRTDVDYRVRDVAHAAEIVAERDALIDARVDLDEDLRGRRRPRPDPPARRRRADQGFHDEPDA